jgi:uncharacterized RDD family membrane protein YckC
MAEPTHAELAPLGRRTLAHIVDFSIFNALGIVTGYALLACVFLVGRSLGWVEGSMNSAFHPYVNIGIDGLSTLILGYVYYVWPQAHGGQSLGKKWLKLEIVMQNGEPLTPRASLIRTAGYLVSYVVLGCGFLMAFFHPRRQALHDLMAGTITIRSEV